MTKLLKIGFKGVSISLELLLLTFIVLSFAIRLPAFQTFLAQKASAWLSEELETVVLIERVDIAFFDHVYLDGIYVEDQDGDTLAYLEQVEVNISGFDWGFSKIELDKVALSNGRIYLIKKLGQDEFNYRFIEDYFASDEPPKPSDKPAPKIFLSNLMLNDIDFKYILEYRRDYEYGINFNKLDLRKINLFVENLSIIDEHLAGDIVHLSASEKSGFILDKFSAHFDLDAARLWVKQGVIETEKSRIEVPELSFFTKTYDNYNYFEDSVFMDIRLANTIASIEDIAYFAPDLWGMNQDVFLSGRATDYVYNLKIKDLYLETGRETILRGNFELPDFRKETYSIPQQQIVFAQSSYRDLKDFRLPNNKEGIAQYINFPKDVHTQRILNMAELVQISQLKLYGNPDDFNLYADQISSGIGTVFLTSGMRFMNQGSTGLSCVPIADGIQLSNIDLGKIAGVSNLGLTSGNVFFKGNSLESEKINFSEIEAHLAFLDLNGYRYNNLYVNNGKADMAQFTGHVNVKDPNAKLDFEGLVRYDQREEVKGLVQIDFIDFEKIGLKDFAGIYASGEIEVDLFSFSLDKIHGFAHANDFYSVSG